jgi:hypothetical protein
MTDYSIPVLVNGYACHNCTDVDYAKKHIDPQHPKDGPFGVDKTPDRKAQDPNGSSATTAPDWSPAVVFGGRLAGVSPPDNDPQRTRSRPASSVDIRV